MNLLILYFATCMFMTGLIWFVQVVHYPLFVFQNEQSFSTYEASHIRRTGFLVVPAMILELLSAGVLLWEEGANELIGSFLWINTALLGLTWAFTFFVQVPQHSRLQQEFSLALVKKLVFWNWSRTMLWSARSLILLYLISLYASPL